MYMYSDPYSVFLWTIHIITSGCELNVNSKDNANFQNITDPM